MARQIRTNVYNVWLFVLGGAILGLTVISLFLGASVDNIEDKLATLVEQPDAVEDWPAAFDPPKLELSKVSFNGSWIDYTVTHNKLHDPCVCACKKYFPAPYIVFIDTEQTVLLPGTDISEYTNIHIAIKNISDSGYISPLLLQFSDDNIKWGTTETMLISSNCVGLVLPNETCVVKLRHRRSNKLKYVRVLAYAVDSVAKHGANVHVVTTIRADNGHCNNN